MTDSTQIIYVALIDEGVDVWRPVTAEHLGKAVYRIAEQPYDRATEHWEFQPGDEVVCILTASETGPMLTALRRAETGGSRGTA